MVDGMMQIYYRMELKVKSLRKKVKLPCQTQWTKIPLMGAVSPADPHIEASYTNSSQALFYTFLSLYKLLGSSSYIL